MIFLAAKIQQFLHISKTFVLFVIKKAQNLRFGLLFLFRYFDISISRYIDLPIKLQRSRH